MVSLPPIAATYLEASALAISGITQPFKGASLKALYLEKSVLLMGEDALQVPMDPLEFILTPLSMTDAKYQLWRSGILYTQ